MIFARSMLQIYKKFEIPEPVGLGNGYAVIVLGVGNVKVISPLCHGKKIVEWMFDVVYVSLVFMQQL